MITNSNKIRDILEGIIFSLVISVIPAGIFAVILIKQNPDISLLFIGTKFLIALLISTPVLFLIRRFVKGFSRTFSVIFLILFGLAYIFITIHSFISARTCNYYNGYWQRDSYQRYSSGGKCVIQKADLQSVPTTSILYSEFNKLEAID